MNTAWILRRIFLAAALAAPVVLAACEYHKVSEDGTRERISREEYERLQGN
ncbi:MAG: hypothetical protein AAF823_04710 [Planctomycetota bacterium]